MSRRAANRRYRDRHRERWNAYRRAWRARRREELAAFWRGIFTEVLQ